MIIGITGASGFIGRAMVKEALRRGHHVVGYSRRPERKVPGCEEMRALRPPEPADVRGVDVMIHLAGESIMGYWTRKKKRRILESRVETTRALVAGFEQANRPPRVLLSTSAIGIYGDRGEEVLTETSAIGKTGKEFLTDVGVAWEAEARKAEQYGSRVVCMRIGFVMGRSGGAMKILRPIFWLGGGGRLGKGNQWMSWIHLQDVVGMYFQAMEDSWTGETVNVVGPEPVTNQEFTRILGEEMHRPTIFPVPAWLLKGILGEFSHLLLDSQRVLPIQAQENGYEFQVATPQEAMQIGNC